MREGETRANALSQKTEEPDGLQKVVFDVVSRPKSVGDQERGEEIDDALRSALQRQGRKGVQERLTISSIRTKKQGRSPGKKKRTFWSGELPLARNGRGV